MQKPVNMLTVHFKWVNYMLCKVQFNKTVLKSAFQFCQLNQYVTTDSWNYQVMVGLEIALNLCLHLQTANSGEKHPKCEWIEWNTAQ